MKELKRERFVRSSANFNLGDFAGDVEFPQGISETVPDMTLSLREIIDKYARGLPVSIREGEYSDSDYPDFKSMDLSELEDYRLEVAENIALLQEKRKNIIEAFKKKKQEQEAPTPPKELPPPPPKELPKSEEFDKE